MTITTTDDEISTTEAARICGVHPATFGRIAEERGVWPIRWSGKNGHLRIWSRQQVEELASTYEPRQRAKFQISADSSKAEPATTAEWEAICERAELAMLMRRTRVVEICQQTGRRPFEVATELMRGLLEIS